MANYYYTQGSLPVRATRRLRCNAIIIYSHSLALRVLLGRVISSAASAMSNLGSRSDDGVNGFSD
jgi:hypothetical protein